MDWIDGLFRRRAAVAVRDRWCSRSMFALGLGHLLEDGYAATGWLLVGLIQIAVLLAVIGPLQRWRPVEPVTDRARRSAPTSSTRCCTGWACSGWRCSSRVEPLFDELFGMLRVARLAAPSTSTSSGPASPTMPWVSFAALPGGVRLRRLLDPPRPARPELVVEPAFAAPLAAADDDVERQPQPPARRPAARQPAGAAGAADRRGARAVRRHRGHHAAERKPAARQPAAVVRPHRRAAVDQPALPPPAPQHRHRPRDATARRSCKGAAPRWAATTSACCCPGGTCCSAPPTSSSATTPPACATRSSRARDYGRGFWSQQWLGSSAWSAGPDAALRLSTA